MFVAVGWCLLYRKTINAQLQQLQQHLQRNTHINVNINTITAGILWKCRQSVRHQQENDLWIHPKNDYDIIDLTDNNKR